MARRFDHIFSSENMLDPTCSMKRLLFCLAIFVAYSVFAQGKSTIEQNQSIDRVAAEIKQQGKPEVKTLLKQPPTPCISFTSLDFSSWAWSGDFDSFTPLIFSIPRSSVEKAVQEKQALNPQVLAAVATDPEHNLAVLNTLKDGEIAEMVLAGAAKASSTDQCTNWLPPEILTHTQAQREDGQFARWLMGFVARGEAYVADKRTGTPIREFIIRKELSCIGIPTDRIEYRWYTSGNRHAFYSYGRSILQETFNEIEQQALCQKLKRSPDSPFYSKDNSDSEL